MCVCQLLSDIRLTWRGSTGDGRWEASSAASRAEVNRDKRCITSLSVFPVFLCYCPPHTVSFIVSFHVTCCLLANTFIMCQNATQLTTNWCSIKEPGKLDQHFYMCRVLIVSINDLTELLHANVFITVTNCEPKPFYSEINKRLFCTSSSESSYIIAFGMPEAAFSSHILLFMGKWNLYVDI